MSDIIQTRLDELGITVNQLSNISGLAHTHIDSIKNGSTAKPKRDTLVKIGFALFLNIEEINNLLEEYEYERVSDLDDTYLINLTRGRGSYSGLIPIQQANIMNYYMIILSIENKPGNVRLCTGQPHAVFENEDYHVSKITNETSPYKDIEEYFYRTLQRERKRIFDNTLKKYTIDHLICIECLKYYIQKRKKGMAAPEEEFNQIFQYLRKTEYNIKLIPECHKFDFHLRELPEDSKKHKKINKYSVVFAGKRTSHHERIAPGLLGFFAESENLFKTFDFEYKRMEKAAIDESSDKERLIEYMTKLLKDK